MTFEEYLKGIEGLSEEQVGAIVGGMKDAGIYISTEENIDERYGKLKGQHDEVSGKLKAAEDLVKQLKPQAEGNETLQAKVTEYEGKVADAEARAAKAERDAAVKVELLAKGAVPDDVDYLMFKLGASDDVKLGDDGKLVGMDDALTELKTACPSHFRQEGGTRFEGTKLPKTGGSRMTGVTQEQFDKMNIHERNKLYTEDRDAYEALAGKKE